MSKRELVLKISMTADGYVAGPQGELDWLYPTLSDDATDWLVQTLGGASLHLMGSRTFQGMTAWWPRSKEPFAAAMNNIPKAVFSSNRNIVNASIAAALAEDSMQSGPAAGVEQRALPVPLRSWAEAKVLAGDVAENIAQLKRESGSYILVHGGASFVRSLVCENLIDEYRLLVHPVAIGRGQSIFSALEKPRYLHLQDVKVFAGGTSAFIYRPAQLPSSR